MEKIFIKKPEKGDFYDAAGIFLPPSPHRTGILRRGGLCLFALGRPTSWRPGAALLYPNLFPAEIRCSQRPPVTGCSIGSKDFSRPNCVYAALGKIK